MNIIVVLKLCISDTIVNQTRKLINFKAFKEKISGCLWNKSFKKKNIDLRMFMKQKKKNEYTLLILYNIFSRTVLAEHYSNNLFLSLS